MRHLLVIAALMLPTAPAAAQDADAPSFGFDDIAPLAESLRGLMEGFAEDMLPLMEQLAEKMSDLNAYEAPEVLPNGDIIIRRKSKPPEDTPKDAPDDAPEVNPDGSIDL